MSSLPPNFPKNRPPWTKAAKDIEVKRGEDRRHLLHWNEQLRPLFERVMGRLWDQAEADVKKLNASATTAQIDVRFRALLHRSKTVRGWYGNHLPQDSSAITRKIAREINSSTINLAPGSADVNRAIEHVRPRVCASVVALATHPAPVGASHDKQIREARKVVMEQIVEPTQDSQRSNPGDINDAQLEIVRMVQSIVGGAMSRSDLVSLLHDIVGSITYDLSPNARREQIEFTLNWYKEMQADLYRGSPEDELEQFLGLTRTMRPPHLFTRVIAQGWSSSNSTPTTFSSSLSSSSSSSISSRSRATSGAKGKRVMRYRPY